MAYVRKSCERCAEPYIGRRKQRFCSIKCSASWQGESRKGEAHPMWKGDAACDRAKRDRAIRKYPIGKCEACGKRGRERHHKDGNPGNNDASNVMIVCRRCHMSIDGRLAMLPKWTANTRFPVQRNARGTTAKDGPPTPEQHPARHLALVTLKENTR